MAVAPNVQPTVEAATNSFQQLGNVRVVAASNQSGTYFNGPTNNGNGATFTYATGTLTIDSVVVNLNDAVLLADQTAAYENGIYQCTVAGATGVAAVLQRRGDLQNIEQVRLGHYVPVAAGTVYGGSMWTLIEPKPAAIGVPAVSGANNINFATITAAGSSAFLATANNLSEIASAGAAAQASSLGNLGVHAAKATGAGGSATVTITDARIAAANVVVAAIQSSANAVTVEKVTPGSGSLVILLSGDPGANVISYIAISAVE
jgi:hypothetical protein